MAEEQDVVVRRAQAGDAERVAEFVSRALENQVNVGRQDVITRLGEVGFLLAERDEDLVGMLGWRVENLVTRVTDLLIWPASKRLAVGQALFAEMESAAMELQAEAALLFLPRPVSSELIEFCELFGYEPRTLDDLAEEWREAAQEYQLDDGEHVLVKQLRSDRVLTPL